MGFRELMRPNPKRQTPNSKLQTPNSKLYMFYLKSFFWFLRTIYRQKYVIGQLVKRDFQNKYLASYIGLPWAFIQPAMAILVIWFAMTYGLKIGIMDDSRVLIQKFLDFQNKAKMLIVNQL